jgi:hypothetical protein
MWFSSVYIDDLGQTFIVITHTYVPQNCTISLKLKLLITIREALAVTPVIVYERPLLEFWKFLENIK